MIEAYNFGEMIVDGNKFSADLIIFQDFIKHDWWRKKGHEVSIKDIKEDIENFNPMMVIIGTGKFGFVKVLPETKEYLTSKNIHLIAQKTDDAVVTYNKLAQTVKILGAFHLTC